jgi:hypothetical protein
MPRMLFVLLFVLVLSCGGFDRKLIGYVSVNVYIYIRMIYIVPVQPWIMTDVQFDTGPFPIIYTHYQLI